MSTLVKFFFKPWARLGNILSLYEAPSPWSHDQVPNLWNFAVHSALGTDVVLWLHFSILIMSLENQSLESLGQPHQSFSPDEILAANPQERTRRILSPASEL